MELTSRTSSTKAKDIKSGRAKLPYVSRIIRAGALLTDSKAFLLAYDESLSLEENLLRMKRENLLGKITRDRAEEILHAFRRRFSSSEDQGKALRCLVRGSVPPEILDRLIYFYTARSDRLLADFTSQFLYEKKVSGDLEVKPAEESERFLAALLRRNSISWSHSTLRRTVQGLLSTLRDFRILEGAVKKRLAPAHLPIEAFPYIAFLLHSEGSFGENLIRHPDWRLFFLGPQAVERLFLEAHQRRLLVYEAAGKIIRIEFREANLEEMADAIARRAD